MCGIESEVKDASAMFGSHFSSQDEANSCLAWPLKAFLRLKVPHPVILCSWWMLVLLFLLLVQI